MPFLIFVSFSVIVYIVSKHLPEFKKSIKENFDNEKEEGKLKDEKIVKKAKNLFCKIGGFLKNGFFCSIEFVIKKIKQILHLLHFWVLKTKKGKNNGEDELSRELEIKNELIESEEENLEQVMKDDLIEDLEISSGKIKKEKRFSQKNSQIKKEVVEKDPEESIEINDDDNILIAIEDEDVIDLKEKEEKIESFFSEEKLGDSIDFEEKNKKKKFSFKKLFDFIGKIKKKRNNNKKKKEDNLQEDFIENDSFSDGIVDVKEINNGVYDLENSNLIKEVVPVKKSAIDIDDEIGVDRSILEKKLVQKIANNPKDMENYRRLGELYIKMKNFSDAEDCYKQILKVNFRDVDAKRKIEKIKLLKRIG